MKPLEFIVTPPFYDPSAQKKGNDKKDAASPPTTLDERIDQLEAELKGEFDEIEQALDSGKDRENAYMEQMRKENKDIQNNTSSRYWVGVYFADEAHRDEFLKNAGLTDLVEEQYINGQQMADRLKIPLTKRVIEPPKSFKKHKDFTNFTL